MCVFAVLLLFIDFVTFGNQGITEGCVGFALELNTSVLHFLIWFFGEYIAVFVYISLRLKCKTWLASTNLIFGMGKASFGLFGKKSYGEYIAVVGDDHLGFYICKPKSTKIYTSTRELNRYLRQAYVNVFSLIECKIPYMIKN